MIQFLLVGAGGFFGAVSRWGVGLLFHPSRLHYGTLAVNLIGCLLIGIAFGLITRGGIDKADPRQLLLVTGFLGGFTTFSTFGLDTLKMIHQGAYAGLVAYVAISVVAGIALVAVGYQLVKGTVGL